MRQIGLVNKNSKYSADYVAQLAWEAGYLRDEFPTYQDINPNRFVDLVKDDVSAKGKHYSNENAAYQEAGKFGASSKHEGNELERMADFQYDDDILPILQSVDATGEITNEQWKTLQDRREEYGLSDADIRYVVNDLTANARNRAEAQANTAATSVLAESLSQPIFAEEEFIDESEPEGDVDLSSDFSDEDTTPTPKPNNTLPTDLFGNPIEPKHQEGLFGASDVPAQKTSVEEIADIYGNDGAKLIYDNSKTPQIDRVKQTLIDTRKLVAAKGEQTKTIASDAMDALELYTQSVNQKSTVAEVLSQPRMDGVEFSDKSKSFARAMEVGNFDNVFGRDLSQAKTDVKAEALRSTTPKDSEKAKLNRLDSHPPVVIDSTNLPAIGSNLQESAKNIYKNLKPAVNKADGKEIQFVMTGFSKMKSHSADTRVLRIVSALPELVEEATPLYTEAHKPKPADAGKRTNIVAWHTYAVRANLDGEIVYVKLVARESRLGKLFIDHFHDASVTSEAEVQKDLPRSALPVSNRGQSQVNPLDIDRLREWYQKVKNLSGDALLSTTPQNKEKSRKWFESAGLQLPIEKTVSDNSKILTENDFVKDSGGDALRSTTPTFVNPTAKELAIRNTFRNAVDNVLDGSRSPDTAFRLANESPVLRALGMSDRPLVIAGSTFLKDVQTKHFVTREQVKKLPELLDNPVMVLKSATQTDAKVVVLDAIDTKGQPLIAAIHLDRKVERYIVNYVASMYGKTDQNFFARQIADGNLEYINKQKMPAWAAKHSLQLRNLVQSTQAKYSILTEEDIVKTNDDSSLRKIASRRTNEHITAQDNLRQVADKTLHNTVFFRQL